MLLGAVGLAFPVGCFTSPEPSKLLCSTDEHCPRDYVCVGYVPSTNTPGTCRRKALDAGGIDLPPATWEGPGSDGGGGSELAALLDSGLDGTASPDVGIDAPLDFRPEAKALPEVGEDRASQVRDSWSFVVPDLPPEASPDDAPGPDLHGTESYPSQTSDAAESEDLASPDLPGPDLLADAPSDLVDAIPPSPDAPCGALGQACCPVNACNESGTVCGNGGTCVACGAEGSPCCAGGGCGSAANVCSGNLCVACGGSAQPCCSGGSCASSGYVCASNQRCVACGSLGQPCCAGSTCAAPGSVCGSTGSCVACGTLGLPCCAGNVCSATGTVCAGTGSCVACGGIGQTCCAANTCTDPTAMCDSNGSCVTCTSPGIVERPSVEFGPLKASSPKFFPIDATHFLVLNTVSEPIDNSNACTSWPIYATILTLNMSSGTVTAGATRALAGLGASAYLGRYVTASLVKLEANKFLLLHGNCTTWPDVSQGYAEIVAFDLAHDVMTLGSPTVFESGWMTSISAASVDATHVVLAYQTGSNLGKAGTITFNPATGSLGMTVSQWFGGTGQAHGIVSLADGRFLDVYRGGSSGSAVRVLTVTLSPQLSLSLGTESSFDTASYSGGSLFKIDSSNVFVISSAGRSTRAFLLRVNSNDGISVAARASSFPGGATIDGSVSGGGPLALTHYLAWFSISDVGQFQSMKLNEVAGTIALGGVTTCGTAGCPRIVASIDSTRVLGYRVAASTRLSAGIVETHCP